MSGRFRYMLIALILTALYLIVEDLCMALKAAIALAGYSIGLPV